MEADEDEFADAEELDAFDGEGIPENELLSIEETSDFQADVERIDVSMLMLMLESRREEMDNTVITVALVGQSGSGKSSLINALRGLKDDDPGAAKTGCIEKTTEPTFYPYPKNKNMQLWDLPGVGTPNFPKERYLDKVRFDDYDFILLVSCTRFTEDDAWLASQIKSKLPDVKLFFIRTKVDNDLKNTSGGRRKPLTQKEKKDILEEIKNDCFENLTKKGVIEPYVFLVNSHNIYELDFKEFITELIQKVADLKRNALIQSMNIITDFIVPLKVKILNERKAMVSKNAAKTSIIRNPIIEGHPELHILKAEIDVYMDQLGIDKESVKMFTELFNAERADVEKSQALVTFHMQQCFEKYVAWQNKQEPSKWLSLPLIGKWMALKKYQTKCYNILKTVLGVCVKENEHILSMVESFTSR